MLHRAWIEYCNTIHKNSKRYQGTLLTIQCNLGKIWKTHPPRCPENTFPEILCIKYLHLISNGPNGVNINLLTLTVLYYKFLCSTFSKGTQPFDFIKRNIIQTLAYKIKYVVQINGCLIMLFGHLKGRFFFKLVGSIINDMERTNTRKWNTINIVQCSRC